jgi:hypothetical protein
MVGVATGVVGEREQVYSLEIHKIVGQLRHSVGWFFEGEAAGCFDLYGEDESTGLSEHGP